MNSTRCIGMALLAMTTTLWLPQTAQAEKPDGGSPRKAQRQGKPGQDQHQQPMKRRDSDPAGLHRSQAQPSPHMSAPSSAGAITIGAYFQPHHLEAARSYFGRQENTGFCPPGLAKKGNGCLPPGQAKKWRKGAPLPAGVVYYDVPRSVVVSLGAPPAGYKYVRVASDILLIAMGTSMVIDAIEDLVR
jgi:Ni/Co efflux regulator RcnB